MIPRNPHQPLNYGGTKSYRRPDIVIRNYGSAVTEITRVECCSAVHCLLYTRAVRYRYTRKHSAVLT